MPIINEPVKIVASNKYFSKIRSQRSIPPNTSTSGRLSSHSIRSLWTTIRIQKTAIRLYAVSKDIKEFDHLINLFAFYAKWIKNFSDYSSKLTKARETINTKGLNNEEKEAIQNLKEELINAS